MIELAEDMYVTSERPRQAQKPHTEHHSDQILPSIEQPSDWHNVRNPFQQGRSENQNAGPNRINSYAEQYESMTPSARVPVNAYTDTGKKQGLEGERAYASQYNHGQAVTGKVLIPLEEYHQRHRRQAQIPDGGEALTLGLPSAEENHGSPYRVKDRSSLRKSPITPPYASHTWKPQENMLRPTGQHQRRPHLQIQLHSGAPAMVDVRRTSPYAAFQTPQSDSLTSPTSQLNRGVAHRVSGSSFLSRTSSVSIGSEFRERDPTDNVLVYAPKAARVEQDAFELRRRASYINHNSTSNDSINPFQDTNTSYHSYPKPGPAIGVTGSWEKALNTQQSYLKSPQNRLETRLVAHSTQEDPFLPFRSRQPVIQPFERSLPSHNSPGKHLRTPTYQPRNSLRYVACRDCLTYLSWIV